MLSNYFNLQLFLLAQAKLQAKISKAVNIRKAIFQQHLFLVH